MTQSLRRTILKSKNRILKTSLIDLGILMLALRAIGLIDLEAQEGPTKMKADKFILIGPQNSQAAMLRWWKDHP